MTLVAGRQAIMKDAWLSAAGHKRPGMTKGLSLEEANKKYKEIQLLINKILKDRNSKKIIIGQN